MVAKVTRWPTTELDDTLPQGRTDMFSRKMTYASMVAAQLLIAGFATIASAQPVINDELPAIALGELALDRHYQQSGLQADAATVAAELVAKVAGPDDLVLPADFGEQDIVAVQSQIDPSASMEFDLNLGHLFINKGMAPYDEEESTPGLPDSNDAAIEKFYGHLDEFNLKPHDNEIGGVDVGSLNMAIIREDGSTDEYEKFVTVYIARMLNGMPVLGASRIIGRLGKDGELHSLVYNWTPVTSEKIDGAKDVRMDNDVNALVEEGLMTKGANAKSINVFMKEVVLYDDGMGTIEPVVYVVGDGKFETVDSEGVPAEVTIPVDFFVPILKNSMVRLPDGQDLPAHVPDLDLE